MLQREISLGIREQVACWVTLSFSGSMLLVFKLVLLRKFSSHTRESIIMNLHIIIVQLQK